MQIKNALLNENILLPGKSQGNCFPIAFPPPPRKFNGATRNVPQTWKFCDTRITNITNITSSSLEKNQ